MDAFTEPKKIVDDMSRTSSHATFNVPVFSVWIVNKSGGLIFYKNYANDEHATTTTTTTTTRPPTTDIDVDFSTGLDINDTLRLASVWHSLHAISRTRSVAPVRKSSGIELLETSTFNLHCFETKTGIKFMVVGGKNAIGVERLLRRVYDVYADFAMKNPFYELEQPIQAELFEERVMIAVRSCRNANSSNGTSGGGGGGYPSSASSNAAASSAMGNIY